MVAHYFPQIDLNDISDDDFAFWSENAQWLHAQMCMLQQANSVAMLGGGGGQSKQ